MEQWLLEQWLLEQWLPSPPETLSGFVNTRAEVLESRATNPRPILEAAWNDCKLRVLKTMKRHLIDPESPHHERLITAVEIATDLLSDSSEIRPKTLERVRGIDFDDHNQLMTQFVKVAALALIAEAQKMHTEGIDFPLE